MRFFPTQRQLVQWSYTFGEVNPVAQKLLVITSNSQTNNYAFANYAYQKYKPLDNY